LVREIKGIITKEIFWLPLDVFFLGRRKSYTRDCSINLAILIKNCYIGKF